jgi:hypothetical protein
MSQFLCFLFHFTRSDAFHGSVKVNVCMYVHRMYVCIFLYSLLHAPLHEQYYMPYSNIYNIIYNL